jgi:hypothetical protein
MPYRSFQTDLFRGTHSWVASLFCVLKAQRQLYWNVAFDFGVMLMQFRDQATSYNPKEAYCAVMRGLVGSNALETVRITLV